MNVNEQAQIMSVKIYVDGEFALTTSFILNNNYPNTSPIQYIREGYDYILYHEDFYNLPTSGMIYNGESFIDGPNGETFRNHLPAYDFPIHTFVFLKNNIVLGYYIITESIGSAELLVAALKSNPTFEIEE